MTLDLEVRQAVETDYPFIYHSWLRTYKYGSYFAKKIKPDLFFKHHHAVVERILHAESSKTLIANPSGESNIILGYLVTTMFDRPVMQFVYVKEDFRKFGIANRLIKESGIDLKNSYFTHWTFDCDWIVPKSEGLTYCPYLI